jgi:hypothetical protein
MQEKVPIIDVFFAGFRSFFPKKEPPSPRNRVFSPLNTSFSPCLATFTPVKFRTYPILRNGNELPQTPKPNAQHWAAFGPFRMFRGVFWPFLGVTAVKREVVPVFHGSMSSVSGYSGGMYGLLCAEFEYASAEFEHSSTAFEHSNVAFGCSNAAFRCSNAAFGCSSAALQTFKWGIRTFK